MDKTYYLYAGGVLHAGWAIFHLLFARIFKWGDELKKLDVLNQRIYPILNICLTFYFFAAAYLSFFFASEMVSTPLGKKLIAVFAAFWLLRLGLQFRFFNGLHPISLLLNFFFVLTLVAYAIPLLR